MSETTFFLIPSDRSPTDKSRRVIEENVERRRKISNTSSPLRDLIFILRSYRRFHVFTRNLRRKHARFRFHQYFHANHTRPMISKLFDRKPPISGTSKLFEEFYGRKFFKWSLFSIIILALFLEFLVLTILTFITLLILTIIYWLRILQFIRL